MAHAQKPYFVFRAKRTSPFKSARGASVQSTTGSRGVRISSSNAGYTMFRGSVKSTGYPLHSPVSPSLSLPCVTVCHHISTAVYKNKGLGAEILTVSFTRNFKRGWTVHRGKPAWHDATNTRPVQPQDLLHTVDRAIKEGQIYFSQRNTQQIQDTTDNHPACYQSQHKVDQYHSPNWKFREYK